MIILKKTADKCIKEYTEIWEKVIKNYEIIYKIKKDIFSSLQQNLGNFQKLSNQGFIFKQYDDFFLANIEKLQIYDVSRLIFMLFQKMESKPIVEGGKHFGVSISIKTPSGGAFELSAGFDDTVETIKFKIWEKTGLPPFRQKLFSEGKELEDKKEIGYCGRKMESTIYVIYKY